MKSGDRIRVATATEELEGRLMPSTRSGYLVLKLDSGYNIGIDESKIKNKELVKAAEPAASKETSVEQKKGLKKIAILHTGGTIASKIDYSTGGVIAQFSAEDMLNLFPELTDIANITSRQIASMQSEMMRFAHHNLIAREVAKEVENGVDGVIVTHGTDTLHYSSAALAFILEGLSVPVLLVGSQRSSDRGSTDAADNLLSAAYFIAESDFAGVGICMHENSDDANNLILPATKSRKMHTSRRDAFRPINTTAIARVNYAEKNISFISEYEKRNKKTITLKLIKEDIKVGIVKVHPNISADQFAFFSGYDGLVLEGTGLGHIPNQKVDDASAENAKIQKAVEKLVADGTVVADSSQCIYGRVHMNVYTPLRELQDIGVVGHLSDMTPETTFIKLAWLLSNYSKDEAKKLLTENLRGEITERTEKETFLV